MTGRLQGCERSTLQGGAQVRTFVAAVVLALASATGAAQTPHLVADLNPAGSIYQVLDVETVGDTIFFLATDTDANPSLWKSDGTSLGTQRLASVPGSGPSFGLDPFGLIDVNGTLLFGSGGDEDFGQTLWKSDGTPAGTGPLTDAVRGILRIVPFVRVNREVYFFAAAPGAGVALWKSDGTAAGTTVVKILHSLDGLAFAPAGLMNANGTLFFSAYQPATGHELWKSDGTEEGTALVKDILPGPDSSSPAELISVRGTVYFMAMDPAGGLQLWRSDGTDEGTTRVAMVNPSDVLYHSASLTDLNGTLLFSAFGNAADAELWRSDGTAPGTTRIGGARNPHSLTVVNHTLFFVAFGGGFTMELWKSDGTANGTELVKRFEPRRPGIFADVDGLTQFNGMLVFNACDANSSPHIPPRPVASSGRSHSIPRAPVIAAAMAQWESRTS